jgi:hypothetical protein
VAFDRIGGPSGIEARIDAFSAWADTVMPAHAVPLDTPYPTNVVLIVELRTACLVVASCGLNGYARLIDREDSAIADFLRFASGMPMRSVKTGARTNLAIATSKTRTDAGETIP